MDLLSQGSLHSSWECSEFLAPAVLNLPPALPPNILEVGRAAEPLRPLQKRLAGF